jgi:hypothetical protein
MPRSIRPFQLEVISGTGEPRRCWITAGDPATFQTEGEAHRMGRKFLLHNPSRVYQVRDIDTDSLSPVYP